MTSMKRYTLCVDTLFQDKIILKNILLADTFWSRFSGYMLRKKPHVSGILFTTSGSMQTTFMMFNIDIVFMDKDNRVVKVLRDVRPWRFTKIYKRTSRVLEVPAGQIPLELREGKVLSFT